MPQKRDYGMGGLRQLSNGKWEATFRVQSSQGKGRPSKTFPSKADAKRWLGVQRDLVLRGIASGPITLQQHLTDYLEDIKRTKRAATYRLRETHFRLYVLPNAVDHRGRPIKLSELTPDRVRTLLQRLRENGVSESTLASTYAGLSAACSAAVIARRLAFNPVRGVPKPVASPKPQPMYGKEEAYKFLEQARKGPYFALYLLALTSGLREGEMWALRQKDVDLAEATVTIDGTLTTDLQGRLGKTPTKTPLSRRRVAIGEAVRSALAALCTASEAAGYHGELVFTDSTGGPLRKSNFLRRVHKPLLEAAGLPYVTFHRLRHIFTTLAILEGENIAIVSQILGHSSIRTTVDRYGHLQRPEAQRSIAALGDRLYGSTLKLADKLADSTSASVLAGKRRTRTPFMGAGPVVVEVSGLEPLTPYMRSKCSTS
jgi:integrase